MSGGSGSRGDNSAYPGQTSHPSLVLKKVRSVLLGFVLITAVVAGTYVGYSRLVLSYRGHLNAIGARQAMSRCLGMDVRRPCSAAKEKAGLCDKNEVGPTEFQTVYRGRKPLLLLRGAVDEWLKRDDWPFKLDDFLAHYGDAIVNQRTASFFQGSSSRMTERPRTLRALLQDREEAVTRYGVVFDGKSGSEDQNVTQARMRAAFRCPQWVVDATLCPRVNQNDRWDEILSVGVGSPLAGVPFHLHGDAWLALILGIKIWHIVEPGKLTAVVRGVWHQPPARWKAGGDNIDGIFTCEQHPGELMYVPESWSHQTFNSETTIGFGHQIRWPTNETFVQHMATATEDVLLKYQWVRMVTDRPRNASFTRDEKLNFAIALLESMVADMPSFFAGRSRLAQVYYRLEEDDRIRGIVDEMLDIAASLDVEEYAPTIVNIAMQVAFWYNPNNGLFREEDGEGLERALRLAQPAADRLGIWHSANLMSLRLSSLLKTTRCSVNRGLCTRLAVDLVHLHEELGSESPVNARAVGTLYKVSNGFLPSH